MNSFYDPKMPEIKFNEETQFGDKFNWNEIEQWMHFNMPVARHAWNISNERNFGDTDRAHFLIALLAQQNQEQREALIKIKMAEPMVFTVPRNMVFRPSIWKRIWRLIRTGEWIY